MSLLALVCPECGAAFDPGPEDSIHACPSCRLRWEIGAGGAWESLPRWSVRPAAESVGVGEPWSWLPVWQWRRSSESGSVFVPAFGAARLPLLVRAAVNLTRARPEFDVEDRPAPRTLSAELDAEDALAVAEIVVLATDPLRAAAFAHSAPADGPDADLGAGRLLDWPFEVRRSEIVDVVAGIALPAALLAGVDAKEGAGAATPVPPSA